MTTINTATEARALVLECIKNTSMENILGFVVEWNNTTENEIAEDGSVWVANPQVGHWLNDDAMIEFAIFLVAA